MTAADERPALRCRQVNTFNPVPYVLTDLGRAALDAWQANRIEHEPRTSGPQPCDGRGCRCTFPDPKGGAT